MASTTVAGAEDKEIPSTTIRPEAIEITRHINKIISITSNRTNTAKIVAGSKAGIKALAHKELLQQASSRPDSPHRHRPSSLVQEVPPPTLVKPMVPSQYRTRSPCPDKLSLPWPLASKDQEAYLSKGRCRRP